MGLYTVADSQGKIISILGYPKVIAKIMQKNFGSDSFVIAKWLKEYVSPNDKSNWWDDMFPYSKMKTYIQMYEAAQKGEEYYLEWRKFNGFSTKDFLYDLNEHAAMLEKEIEDILLDSYFFHSSLIKDYMASRFSLQHYKKLSFDDALHRFSKKKIFSDDKIIKEYDDGWKWVNVGSSCEYVGREMSNCGSSGLMSDDPNSTIITLFSPDFNPKAMVVWSPNQKRLSGAEGKAQSPVDSQYHDKVIDLAKVLGAKYEPRTVTRKDAEIFLYDMSGSKPEVFLDTYVGRIYKIKTPDGKVWLTNDSSFVELSDFESIKSKMLSEDYPEYLKPYYESDEEPVKLVKIFNDKKANQKTIGLYEFEKRYRNSSVASIISLKSYFKKQGNINAVCKLDSLLNEFLSD